MISIEAFRRLPSANTWLELVDARLPSAAANAIIAAACGAPTPSPEVLDAWTSISDRPFPTSAVSHLILQIGRAGFKSSMMFALAIDRLLRFDPRPFIAAGSEVTATIIAPTMKQASSLVRSNRALAESVAALLGGRLVVRDMSSGAEMIFDIPNLGFVARLVVGPADESSLRGGAYAFFGASEAGWFPHGPRSLNTLSSLRIAVVPRGKGQFPHFMECYESTNGAPAGYFYESCQDPPATALKIGPLSSGRVNPAIDEAKLREELKPEEYSQEIECLTWGLRDTAFIPAAPAMAIVDEDAEWTSGTITNCPGARVAFDHGGRDEIAVVLGRAVDVEASSGQFVKHLVVDFADFWRPERAPPTVEQVRLPLKIAGASGGVPILCDGRAIADVSAEAAKMRFKSPDVADDVERRKFLARGGRLVIQMPMDPRRQTERFSRLRELVLGGRVHVVDSEAGRELARQISTLRATQLASRYLRIEAEAGSEDGLADCLSYLAESFETMPATRSNGERIVQVSRSLDMDQREWRRVGPNGEDLGRSAPPIDHPTFARHFAASVANGMFDNDVVAFAKQRLGRSADDQVTIEDAFAVLAELERSGEVGTRHPIHVPVDENHDPWGVAFAASRGRF